MARIENPNIGEDLTKADINEIVRDYPNAFMFLGAAEPDKENQLRRFLGHLERGLKKSKKDRQNLDLTYKVVVKQATGVIETSGKYEVKSKPKKLSKAKLKSSEIGEILPLFDLTEPAAAAIAAIENKTANAPGDESADTSITDAATENISDEDLSEEAVAKADFEEWLDKAVIHNINTETLPDPAIRGNQATFRTYFGDGLTPEEAVHKVAVALGSTVGASA